MIRTGRSAARRARRRERRRRKRMKAELRRQQAEEQRIQRGLLRSLMEPGADMFSLLSETQPTGGLSGGMAKGEGLF